MAVIYIGNKLIPVQGVDIMKEIEAQEEAMRYSQFIAEMGPIELIEQCTDDRGLTSIVFVNSVNDTVALDFLTAEEYKQLTHNSKR